MSLATQNERAVAAPSPVVQPSPCPHRSARDPFLLHAKQRPAAIQTAWGRGLGPHPDGGVQIYAPLNYFGSYYRQIQRNMIDMENMFELLAESGAVEDCTDAVRFELKRGDIEFWDVSFSYKPDRSILQRVSFCVCPCCWPPAAVCMFVCMFAR